MPMGEYMQPLIGRVQETLAAAGVTMAHFDGVVPNPTTDCVSAGAAMARQLGAEAVVGIWRRFCHGHSQGYRRRGYPPWHLLGLSLLQDPAYTCHAAGRRRVNHLRHRFAGHAGGGGYRDRRPRQNLPSTTALLYPRVAIVDPELMVTVPPHVTASTGFDAFTHAFESYLHVGGSPYVDMLALEAIRLVVAYLPFAYDDGKNADRGAPYGMGRHTGGPVHRQCRRHAAARHRHDDWRAMSAGHARRGAGRHLS